jgi:diamine N-acetyltransferase
MTPIRLRPTDEPDLPFVLDAEAAADNRRYVAQWTHAHHAAALGDPDLRHLIIERLEDQAPVGYLILAGLESPHRSIEFRRIVVTEKGKGYGRHALRLVKRLAFEERGAHRLWLDVKDHNARARQLYRSESFVEEGTLRECHKIANGYESLVIMSMLEDEYAAQGRFTAATNTKRE